MRSSIYYYDQENRMIKERLDTGFKDLCYLTEYEYNPLGYRASRFLYKSNDVNYTLKEFDSLKSSNSALEKTLISHEDVIIDDEKVISKKISNYSSEIINLTENEYENSLITLKKYYSISRNKKELIWKIEFKYDSENRILEKKFMDFQNENNSELVEYQYSNGKVVETTFDINREGTNDQIEIDYDNQRNIIKKSDGTIFIYVKEDFQILEKEYLTAIIEGKYDEDYGFIKSSVTFFEYSENHHDIKYSLYNQTAIN